MNSTNPLAMFMRQPKIYIRLPSGGEFWPDGSIDIPENGELPVFSMTANDELMLKVPDALMNGQAIVDVIHHCIPNIKNAWHIPSIDLDILLIALRIATYGEMMTTPVKFGNLELEYQIDLRVLMDQQMNNIKWNNTVSVGDNLTVFVRPLTYKNITELALQTFETQKILQVVNDDKISDEQKVAVFKDSFKKLSEATIGTMGHSIERIESINGTTNDPAHINEFLSNVDKEIFNIIQKHLDQLKDQNSIKPMILQTTDEMREHGVTTDTVEIPITFDPSTFFV